MFGVSLNGVYSRISDAQTKAAEAQKLATKAVVDLADAKTKATDEIASKGQGLLVGYKSDFAKWVADEEAPLVPHGIAIALLGNGPIPHGWNPCDGIGGRPDLESQIFVGGKSEGSVTPDEQPVRRSEVERLTSGKVTNQTAGFYRVRYICR